MVYKVGSKTSLENPGEYTNAPFNIMQTGQPKVLNLNTSIQRSTWAKKFCFMILVFTESNSEHLNIVHICKDMPVPVEHRHVKTF